MSGGTVVGTFDKFEVGDYYHLVMTTDDGEERLFWCSQACEPLIEREADFTGRRIQLRFEVQIQSVPEDPTPTPVEVAMEVKVLD